MVQVELFNRHAKEYDAWFERYPMIFESEVMAIKQQMLKLPTNISGIEVGVGTGRFSQALGIKEGVEPADNMRESARKRGLEVTNALAERLPYRDLHFDFVLFVTICYLKDVSSAFKEANRVLKRGGSIIVGVIRADSPIGLQYKAKKDSSTFYQHASFYEVTKVETLLEEAGFRDFEYMQTLFGELEDIQEAQAPKEGFDEGSFVVIKATKK